MRAVKHAAASVLVGSGALALRRRLAESGRAIVLAYHRINDDADPFFPSLPVARFAAHLDYLGRHYRIEPLESVVAWLAAGAVGPARVAITIDDGYPDTFHAALPELSRRGLPATLFLATAPVETGRAVWIDRLRQMLKQARVRELALPAAGLGPLPLTSPQEKLRAIDRILAALKHRGPADVDAAVAEVEARLDGGAAGPEVLTWDQVRRLAAGGVAIGAHTHRHYMLPWLGEGELEQEIATSLQLIRDRTGNDAAGFAYPNGDYDRRSVACLARLGVRYAVTSVSDFARPSDDPLELPRLYTSDASLPRFALRVAGVARKRRASHQPRPAAAAGILAGIAPRLPEYFPRLQPPFDLGLSGPALEMDSSTVLSVSVRDAAGHGEALAVKVFREGPRLPYAVDATLRAQFESLREAARVNGSVPLVRSPHVYEILPEHKALVMERVTGQRLLDHLSAPIVRDGRALVRACGDWLRRFHQARAVGQWNGDVETRLRRVQALLEELRGCGLPAPLAERLAAHAGTLAAAVDMSKVLACHIHCDFSASNVLVEPGGRLVVLDIGRAEHPSPADGDLGAFLASLDAGALHPRRLSLSGRRARALGADLLEGYFGSRVPPPPLTRLVRLHQLLDKLRYYYRSYGANRVRRGWALRFFTGRLEALLQEGV